MSFDDQSEFDIRFDWGVRGLEAIGGDAIVVIVDVLSFTTTVSIACSRGAVIEPSDAPAAKREGKFTLSPESFLTAEAGLRVVLSSPNGSALAVAAMRTNARVIMACLRNAGAVARWLEAQQKPVAVIAAGERWPDGTMRFAFEDLIGAGAVIAGLTGSRSPEAEAAAAAFNACRSRLFEVLGNAASGRELIERGFERDVALAAELDADVVVPHAYGSVISAQSSAN